MGGSVVDINAMLPAELSTTSIGVAADPITDSAPVSTLATASATASSLSKGTFKVISTFCMSFSYKKFDRTEIVG